MAGKIAGMGPPGILQLIFIATFAIALASVTGAIDLPADSYAAAAIMVGWFVLGFAFYAAMFAVAGALVSRMEELQNAIVPTDLVVFVSFLDLDRRRCGSGLDGREGGLVAANLLGARDAIPDGPRLGHHRGRSWHR